MTAGVQQSLEVAAYLPSPQPAASPADAKGSAGVDHPAAEAKDPQDFQTELKLQDSDPKDTKSGQSEDVRTKRDKKRDARPDDSPDHSNDDLNIIAAAPAQPSDPPKPIQALALTLAIPEESAKPSESAGAAPEVQLIEGGGRQDSRGSAPAAADKSLELQDRPAPTNITRPAQPIPDAAPALTNLKTQPPAASLSSRRVESTPRPGLPQQPAVQGHRSVSSAPAPRRSSDAVAPEIRPVSENASMLADPLPAQPMPIEPGNQQIDTKNAADTGNQPASNALPPTPPEPAVTAILEAPESAPSRAAALAFAARMSPQQKPGESSAEGMPAPRVISNAPLARIPIRYAPTAQIIPNAEDSDPEIERTLRVPEARTDLIFSRLETAHHTTSVSDAAPAQETDPTARAERVIEPPPAAPASPHDIRVRVPDDNGGATQVRFVESGGEVKVSVRTDDPVLAQNLRSHLNDLTQRLTEGGIPAEIWKPGSSAAPPENDSQNPEREGRGSQGQQSGGNPGQQQHRGDRRPAWLEEMEASLHAQA